jgi:uncharacterized protein YhfF
LRDFRTADVAQTFDSWRRAPGTRTLGGVPEWPARVSEFAFPGPLRDRLVAAVLAGEKTATSSLLVEWEHDGEPLPQAGQLTTVVDSGGSAVGIIELLSAQVIRLGDADLRLAIDEGEGFSSVAQWRAEHERFWNDEVLPTLPAELAPSLNDETLIVVERFRVVG